MTDKIRAEKYMPDSNVKSYSPCILCKHWRGKGSCNAFPDGVPMDILIPRNGIDHKEPYPGDNGIQFERDPDLPKIEGEDE